MDQRKGDEDVVVVFGPPDYIWTCQVCGRIYRVLAEAYECASGCTKTPLTEEERLAQKLPSPC